MSKRVLLMILDGWGISPENKGNAIFAAKTPNLDSVLDKYPSSMLKTSGEDVGLPQGIMGNSEVGHMNIGAGRVVYQLNTKIDNAVREGSFYNNAALNRAIDKAEERNSKLHLFFLLSDGNVHSNLIHLDGMLELCKRRGFKDVFLHAFMDGRDTLPNSGRNFITDYQKRVEELGLGRIATVSGRYYAMDRDNRWDRIELAYKAIVFGEGERYQDPILAVQESYEKEITDEFIIPKVILENDKPVATVEEKDSVVFLNYRADRTRQLTSSFILPDFSRFDTRKFENLFFVSMSEYDVNFNDYLEVAFRNQKMSNLLGEVIADNNLKQLRLAETEKYAHVTFFFNSGREEPFKNEERMLVPSPKVASYDLKPEMSALEVKDTLLKELAKESYSLIVVNFANCDMVGHTGDFQAAVKAVETVDMCVGEVLPVAIVSGYDIIITADHGNAEKMLDEDNNVFTAHTTNPVPVAVISKNHKQINLSDGNLASLAPTILNLLGLSVPEEMTGTPLFEKH